ncbi:hypothetical protein EJV47_23485 [Hymenobacter gummosus]|uniref:Uncharacterized protein n=1 Tax=Hymenobacter gummosus TaxID=1776032 RepID=A0A3S0K1L2_9BACT|nr:hypothetical protein [Hymenobacter gummosus]RTQ45802.1 hypothetical protein EJV47_23485 [Hymenobacter gummosus]
MNTYLGWAPQTWVKDRTPLTAELASQVPNHSADSLVLVVPADGRIQHPSGAQSLRLHLLNPTARPVPIERADATLMGLSLLLWVDGRWVQPVFPMQTYCGNSFWQDTLAPRSVLTLELDADNFYRGTVPVDARARAQVGKVVVKSAVFTVQLSPLQLYYLRHPRVPLPTIN